LIVREARPSPARSSASVVDYDIHGLVGIRLVEPSAGDVSAVSAQLGPEGSLSGEPDLTIRFVDDLQPSSTVSWIQPHEVGFTDEGFFVFTPDSAPSPRARLALDGPGRAWELRCRSGLGAVPLLLPLLDLIMLAKGAIALHASAFTYRGSGVVVAGWARSGKTTALLAFMARGVAFIGDDRVYLDPGEKRIYGLAQPLALRATHLAELPAVADTVGRHGRSRLRLAAALERTASTAARLESLRNVAGRIAGVASDANVSVSPDRLFGDCTLQGRLDKAFLAIAHDRPDVRLEPVEPRRLAERLLFSLRTERLPLRRLYYAFRYAFPDAAEVFEEEAEEAETERLAEAFEGTETYVLFHPFPAPVQAIHDALAPALGSERW
jgi:hypothetical protein